MAGYIIITLSQIVAECASERILKISQLLVKIWTKVKWHTFLAHPVERLMYTADDTLQLLTKKICRLTEVFLKSGICKSNEDVALPFYTDSTCRLYDFKERIGGTLNTFLPLVNEKPRVMVLCVHIVINCTEQTKAITI